MSHKADSKHNISMSQSNVENGDGSTALKLSKEGGCREVTSYLINERSQISIESSSRPPTSLIIHVPKDDGNMPSFIAVEKGEILGARMLLRRWDRKGGAGLDGTIGNPK